LWQLTSTGHLDSDPSWSPDGQMVAYSSERNGRFGIWISRITGGPPVQVTSATARQWQPAWSPDGRYLAFRSESDGGGLFIVAAQGGTPRQIAHFGVRPQWSPDARRVLFFDGLDAYTVTLDGQPPAKLPSAAFPWADSRGRLAWHPDGRRVSAYVTNSENHGTFWTVAVDTNNGPAVRSVVSPEVAARIRDAGLHFGNFSWAPTGDALYFEGRADETQNLWRVRVDPKSLDWIAGPERLTTGTSVESGIALSPDGRRLAFDSRVERTVIWTLPFDPVAGQLLGRGEPVTPDTANAEILDMSPDGQHLAYRVTAHGRQELWIRSIRNSEERMRVMETQASIVQPKWSRDGAYLAYVRTPTDLLQSAAVVVLGARGNDERVFAATQSPEMFYDWSADGRSFLVRCGANIGRAAICLLPASAPPAGNKSDMQLVTSDASRDLYAAKRSPDERWISFIAARSPTTRSAVFVAPMSPRPVPADAWIPMTDGRYFDDKPRWSPDGRVLYFLSNRAGFWNLWGRRFDPDRGLPVGEPFQVSTFDTSLQLVRNTPNLQLAVTRDRLIVPITQTSGAIWVLENLDR
jgi:Tol biopolymer transport system component